MALEGGVYAYTRGTPCFPTGICTNRPGCTFFRGISVFSMLCVVHGCGFNPLAVSIIWPAASRLPLSCGRAVRACAQRAAGEVVCTVSTAWYTFRLGAWGMGVFADMGDWIKMTRGGLSTETLEMCNRSMS